MSNAETGAHTPFASPRVLRDVRFALLGAFEFPLRQYTVLRARPHDRLLWSDGDAAEGTALGEFRNVERFLLGKQLFFGKERPIPSFPPERAAATSPIAIAFRLKGRWLKASFGAVVSYFEQPAVVTLLLHTTFPEISVDELIFLKELKWYQAAAEDWIRVETAEKSTASVHAALLAILDYMEADGLVNFHWPIFDFIELSGVGPSVGGGPNDDTRLSIAEHWGMLTGDEGYRLIDPDEPLYREVLSDARHRFRGRAYFLYQFFPTSCLAFVSRDIDGVRQDWAQYYRESVQIVPDLDAYIGLRTSVACLRDGIPLLVEICLLRYVELCRIDAALGTGRLGATLRHIISRLRGVTPVERAVASLHRLDLYQDSALWIIGGAYTDRLFQYEKIRARVDRSIENIQSSASDIRAFFIAFLSLLVAMIALLWR